MRIWSIFCSFYLFILFLIQPTIGTAAETTTVKSCNSYQFPVSLSPGTSATYQVTGKLCSQGNPSGKTIQVLVHGYTLDKDYWDFPYQPDRYSYVDALTKAGYATLSIDRIGVGESSKPPAVAITAQSNAYVIYQVIKQLRAGEIEGYQFPKVILVGHSLGSMVSIIAAADHGQVDGVVLTGLLHTIDAGNAAALITGSIPSQLDPKFSNASLPLGYLTTTNTTRKQLFYNPTNTDPAIYDLDNQQKGTGTAGELATFETSFLPTYSRNIHVPIFLVIGEMDSLFCNALLSCRNAKEVLQREKLFYSTNGTNLQAYVLENAGHNMNYQQNAKDFYQAVRVWSDQQVGTN